MEKFNGFKNSNVYVEGKGVIKTSVAIENGKIVAFNESENQVELDDKFIVIPGFIDRHVHGANGSDAMYPNLEDLRNICKTVASEGVSSFLPTTIFSLFFSRLNH